MKVTVRARPDREHLQLAFTDPLTGRVKTKSAETKNLREAERAAARWEAELSAYQGSDCTWEAFRRRFNDEYLPKVRPSTRIIYRWALTAFETEFGEVRSMRSIDAGICSQFGSKLIGRQTLRPATIAGAMRHLRVALRWAETIGILQKAPRIVIPRISGRRARARAISEKEFKSYLEHLPKENRDDWIFAARGLWLSGLRISEALRLSWDSGSVRVDLDRKFPVIIFAADGHKANRDERVPMTPDLVEHLRNVSESDRKSHVFKLPYRGKNKVQGEFAMAGRKAEIQVAENKFASAHDFRRSFGERWALRVHPLVLKTLMRHRRIETTLEYYVDLDSDRIAAELYTPLYMNGSEKRTEPKKRSKKLPTKKAVMPR